MADNISLMIKLLSDRKRARAKAQADSIKAATVDPSKAIADSVAVSKERVVAGNATAADSTRLSMANVPGFEPEKPDRVSDYGRALAAIRGGTGDRADSIHVGLQPRAAAPRTPTIGIREGIDPNTGEKVFLNTNSLTGSLTPAKTNYRPAAGADKNAAYEKSVRRVNDIGAEIVKIDNILNDPNMKNGAYRDEFGSTKYYDLDALKRQRNALITEQTHYQSKMIVPELEKEMPASQYTGKTVTDKETGRRFKSDGKSWTLIQ